MHGQSSRACAAAQTLAPPKQTCLPWAPTALATDVHAQSRIRPEKQLLLIPGIVSLARARAEIDCLRTYRRLGLRLNKGLELSLLQELLKA